MLVDALGTELRAPEHTLITMVLVIVLSSIVLLVVLFIGYFSLAPRIGSNSTGERLSRIQALPNYRDGKLNNLVETNMDMPFGTMLGVMWEFIKGAPGREPKDIIPNLPFDRAAWDALPDSGFSFAWFGHSSLLLKVDTVTFLIDPVFGERASTFSFAGPKRFDYTKHMRVELLPKVDVVLLSHDHYDHLCHETMVQLRDKKFVTALGVGAHLEHWGIPAASITEKAWWESVEVGPVKLTLAPARHFSGRGLTNRFSTLWGSWAFECKGQRIYFGADSGYSPTFKEVGERLGPFDLAFLECGAYNERWADIHMMPEETTQAAVDVKAKVLMPIHWAKYSLGMHTWKEPITRLLKKAAELNVELFTPRPGRIVRWPDAAANERWWEGVE
jgi:L-ascorbate metabolism protein UlaG (beta-lactamase superfamily)